MALDALTKKLSTDYSMFPTEAILDLARTAGQVYQDVNGQIRVAGTGVLVDNTPETNALKASTVTSIEKQFARHRGSGAYIY